MHDLKTLRKINQAEIDKHAHHPTDEEQGR